MPHLDEGMLHMLLDGEVSSADLPAVERHLAQCRDCQARLEEARAFRDEAFGLIESLDEADGLEPISGIADRSAIAASPAASATPPAAARQDTPPLQSLAAAKPAGSTSAPADRGRHRAWSRWGRPLAWAATIVVAVGLGYSWRGQRSVIQTSPGAQTAIAEGVAADQRVLADSSPRDAAEPTAVAPPLAQRRAAAPAQPSEPASAELRADTRKDSAPLAAASPQAADRESAKVAPAPAPPAPESAPLNRMAAARARTSDTTRVLPIERPIALSEVVTAGVAPRAPSISADSAIRLLGGSLLLIEGWNPDRYELMDRTVRVVYQTPFGDVALEQWRTDRTVGHQLITPSSAPTDSVAAWRNRIR